MDLSPDEPITAVLARLTAGEPGAAGELLALVYDALKDLARARMAQLQPGQTLQPTALVHEAWLRLHAAQPATWENRAHFFGAAARAMRNILVDRARRRGRLKRGGEAAIEELPLDLPIADEGSLIDVLALHEALNRLEQSHPRPAQVVMLRYFAGVEIAEIAPMLGVSTRTIEREWLFARTSLRRALDTAGLDAAAD